MMIFRIGLWKIVVGKGRIDIPVEMYYRLLYNRIVNKTAHSERRMICGELS
jgi:hypothetical protein